MAEGLIITVLAAWFLLTLWKCVAPPKWSRHLDAADIWHLLPRWRLFNHAPKDFRLWFRDRDRTGRTDAWQHITLSYDRSWWLIPLWNPRFRHSSTLFSLLRYQVVLAYAARWRVTSAIPALRESPPIWAPRSIPSCLLRNYLQHLPADPAKVERQYAILEGHGAPDDADATTRYSSHFFPLASSDQSVQAEPIPVHR